MESHLLRKYVTLQIGNGFVWLISKLDTDNTIGFQIAIRTQNWTLNLSCNQIGHWWWRRLREGNRVRLWQHTGIWDASRRGTCFAVLWERFSRAQIFIFLSLVLSSGTRCECTRYNSRSGSRFKETVSQSRPDPERSISDTYSEKIQISKFFLLWCTKIPAFWIKQFRVTRAYRSRTGLVRCRDKEFNTPLKHLYPQCSFRMADGTPFCFVTNILFDIFLSVYLDKSKRRTSFGFQRDPGWWRKWWV